MGKFNRTDTVQMVLSVALFIVGYFIVFLVSSEDVLVRVALLIVCILLSTPLTWLSEKVKLNLDDSKSNVNFAKYDILSTVANCQEENSEVPYEEFQTNER